MLLQAPYFYKQVRDVMRERSNGSQMCRAEHESKDALGRVRGQGSQSRNDDKRSGRVLCRDAAPQLLVMPHP